MSSKSFGYDGLSLRVRELEDILDMDPSGMAEAGGCSRATYYRYRNGGSMPTLDFLINILNHEKRLSAEWLLKGEGRILNNTGDQQVSDKDNQSQNGHDFYDLPLIEMNRLNSSQDFESIERFIDQSENISIPKILLNLLLDTDYFEDTFVMVVQDDTMIPEVKPGGVVLVDKTKITPTEGVFVVRFDSYVRIKTLQPMPGGRLMLSLVNKKYEPIVIEEKYEGFEVLGRIMLTTHRL